MFPKSVYHPELERDRLRLNLARPRRVADGSILHASLLERIYHDRAYTPRSLTAGFLKSVRAGAPPEADAPYYADPQNPGAHAMP